MMKKLAAVVALSAVCATSAFAADDGAYVGVKLGNANKSVAGVSESNTGFGIFGGFKFNPNIAVEAEYVDLGTVASGFIKFSTMDVAAVGFLPLNNQVSILGRLGMASTTEEFPAAGLSVSRTAPTFGLGAQFDVSQAFALRLSWDRHAFGDGFIFNQGNSDFWSIGALAKF